MHVSVTHSEYCAGTYVTKKKKYNEVDRNDNAADKYKPRGKDRSHLSPFVIRR